MHRYGFNSDGHDAVKGRIEKWGNQKERFPWRQLGVNLGKNKTSADAVGDYTKGVRKLGKYADYLVINVSSPNTPGRRQVSLYLPTFFPNLGLRSLQGRDQLAQLLHKVKEERDRLPPPSPPLLLKIAPDLSQSDKEDIAAVVMRDKVQQHQIHKLYMLRQGSQKTHCHCTCRHEDIQ